MAVQELLQASSDSTHVTTVMVPVLAGGFNATDWLMRRNGQDPYASKKLHMLDATRDERAQIGTRRREEQLARSTQLTREALDHLWATTPGVAARKQALFELWDDCAETDDAALGESGRRARMLVVGFIRARLPATGPDAYKPTELAAFNRAKRSASTFAPYE